MVEYFFSICKVVTNFLSVSRPLSRGVNKSGAATLASLAEHMPACMVPNYLTVVGALGAVLTAAGFLWRRWSIPCLRLACFGLAMNWFGDSLDGTLVWRRRIEWPRYGFFSSTTRATSFRRR